MQISIYRKTSNKPPHVASLVDEGPEGEEQEGGLLAKFKKKIIYNILSETITFCFRTNVSVLRMEIEWESLGRLLWQWLRRGEVTFSDFLSYFIFSLDTVV